MKINKNNAYMKTFTAYHKFHKNIMWTICKKKYYTKLTGCFILYFNEFHADKIPVLINKGCERYDVLGEWNFKM